MKKHVPFEIETELRELAGSPEAYERLLDNLQAQMAEIARKRGKTDLKLDIMAPVPSQPTRHRAPTRKQDFGGSGRVLFNLVGDDDRTIVHFFSGNEFPVPRI